jgi:hypothetical protein
MLDTLIVVLLIVVFRLSVVIDILDSDLKSKLFVVPVMRLMNSVVLSFTITDLVLNTVLPLTVKPSVLVTVTTSFVVLLTLDIVSTSV